MRQIPTFGAAVLLLAGVVAAATPSAAQTPGAGPAIDRIDVQRLGPQVGQKVPDFSLKDQHGVVQTLQSIMGPKGAMLVFFRSADW